MPPSCPREEAQSCCYGVLAIGEFSLRATGNEHDAMLVEHVLGNYRQKRLSLRRGGFA